MRNFMGAAVVLCALAITAGASGAAAGQAAVIPVPANVRAEGLPPIPASLADDLAPYAGSRRALLLAWHPTERRILIWTTFGNGGQIHSVAGPGMARRQLTFFKEGVPPPSPLSPGAWYAPGGASFVFARDADGGAETAQL